MHNQLIVLYLCEKENICNSDHLSQSFDKLKLQIEQHQHEVCFKLHTKYLKKNKNEQNDEEIRNCNFKISTQVDFTNHVFQLAVEMSC